MAKHRMEDGTIVDTAKASETWEEATRWDGRNHISIPTGSQWEHQTLYRSRKGRYYVVHESQWQGSTPHAEWISEHEAVRWMMENDHEDGIGTDLQHLIDEVSE